MRHLGYRSKRAPPHPVRFTEPKRRLVYDARPWTEGEQGRHIKPVNELKLSGDGDKLEAFLAG